MCVCFGVCVNNGDHVGEVQVGSERGEEYIKQREIGAGGVWGRGEEVSMIGALQVETMGATTCGMSPP